MEGEIGEATWEAGETGTQGRGERVGWIGECVKGGGIGGFAFGFEFLNGEPAGFDSAVND